MTKLYTSEQAIFDDLKAVEVKNLANELSMLCGERLKMERDLAEKLCNKIGLPLNKGLRVDIKDLTLGDVIKVLLK